MPDFLAQFQNRLEKADPVVPMPSELKPVLEAATSAASQGLPASQREGNKPPVGGPRGIPLLPRTYGNAIPLGQQLANLYESSKPVSGTAVHQDVAPGMGGEGAQGGLMAALPHAAKQGDPWGPAATDSAPVQQRDAHKERAFFVDHVVDDIRKGSGFVRQSAPQEHPRSAEPLPRSAAGGPSEEAREKAVQEADAVPEPHGDRPSPPRDPPRAPTRSPVPQALSSGLMVVDDGELPHQAGVGVDADMDPGSEQQGIRSGSPESEAEEASGK